MKLNHPTARLALGFGLILAALCLRLNEASAQRDMQSMPGMSATPTPTPSPIATPTPAPTSPSPLPAASATPAEKPAGAAMPGPDMSSMPGMSPAGSPAAKPAESAGAQDMSNMPGMKPGNDMSGMPGMKSGDDMSNMPGMKGSDAAKKGMSGMSGMPGMGGMQGGGGMQGMSGMNQGASSGPPQVSAPGARVLGPSRKWTPRPEDDRSDELQPLEDLKAHMEPLPPPVMDQMIRSFTVTEILEYRFNSSGPDTFEWDIFGWIGTDRNRLWYKTEGSQQLSGDQTGNGDLQLLYGRLIAPFWDLQIGARAERGLGTGRADTRTYAVIGLQGLAPYQFNIEPSLFISDAGQVSARLTVSFDLLLTQRVVLQPRFESSAATQSDRKTGMGSGLNQTELGLRLRYEIRREVAPYIGVSWSRQYGQTASMTRAEGDGTDSVSLVTGVQLWW